MDKEDVNMKLIRALVKKMKEINYLEAKLSLYSMFLTPDEKSAADAYARALKGSDHK